MHGDFVCVDHIRQRQGSIDRKALFHRVTAEEWEFWADDALRRELRHELVSDEVGVDAFGDAGPHRRLLHPLAQSSG